MHVHCCVDQQNCQFDFFVAANVCESLHKIPKLLYFFSNFVYGNVIPCDMTIRHITQSIWHTKQTLTVKYTMTHRVFHLYFIRYNVFLFVWWLSTVMNAKSTCWTDESASSNTCFSLCLSDKSSLTSKKHSQEFPVGSTVTCRQTQTSHWVLHRWANPQVCMHTYRYTQTVCSQQTHTHKEWTSSWSTLPKALLPNIQSYSALYRSGFVSVVCL